MYDLIQDKNNLYRFTVYLHESCEFDIHYICKKLLSELDVINDGNGGEYIVRDKYKAIIALYH